MCRDAETLSKTLVRAWLKDYMFKDLPNKKKLADKAAAFFANTKLHISHSRGIAREQIRAELPDLVIENLEDDPALQDAVLSVHHAVTHTLAGGSAVKLIENHLGRRYVKHTAPVQAFIQGPNA